MKTIVIDGVIGTAKGQVSKAYVRDQMPTDGSPVHFEIHSEGGSAFEGLGIYDLIKEYDGPKTCTVKSCAFSIASFIPMACDEVEITPNGYLMFHNPYMEFEGDAEAFANHAELLGSVQEKMVSAYAAKSGKSEDETRAILKKTTYLPADKALAAGFVDRISAKPVKGRVFAQLNNMPHGVVAALFKDASIGNDGSEKRTKPMDEPKPVAATISMIRAAFPKASNDFIIRCMEKELPMEEVAKEKMAETDKENETLSAKVAAMEKELGELKAVKACSEGDDEEKKDEPMAKAKGVKPVAVAKAGSMISAKARWNEIVEANVKAGLNKVKAAEKANREHGDVRQQMLEEVNQ